MLFSEKNMSTLIIVSTTFPIRQGKGDFFTLFSGGWGVPETMISAESFFIELFMEQNFMKLGLGPAIKIPSCNIPLRVHQKH
jgi:hypothetical protein